MQDSPYKYGAMHSILNTRTICVCIHIPSLDVVDGKKEEAFCSYIACSKFNKRRKDILGIDSNDHLKYLQPSIT